MTLTLEHSAPAMYPVLKPVYANTECARCWRVGRVEWLTDGTVRVLHHGQDGNHICFIHIPMNRLPNGVTELGKALFLLR